jgi:hypothetical protein
MAAARRRSTAPLTMKASKARSKAIRDAKAEQRANPSKTVRAK